MKCKKVQKLLTAYLDGEVPDQTHRWVAEHLAGCENCRRMADETERVFKWAGVWQDRNPSAGFLLRLKARIGASQETSATRRPLWPPRVRWALAGALAGAIFIGGYLAGMILSGGERTPSSTPSLAQAPGPSGIEESLASVSEDSERLVLGIQRIKMVFGSKLSEAAYAELNEVQRLLAARDESGSGSGLRVVQELQRAEVLVRQQKFAEARRVLDAISEEYSDHPLAPYARMARILTTPEPGYGSELLKGVYSMLLQETVGDPREFYEQVTNFPVQMTRLREYGWQKITTSADRLNPLNTLEYLERRILGREGRNPVEEEDAGSLSRQRI